MSKRITRHNSTFLSSTRKGYVAIATHGRVALILRMNGSDRMWCKVLMFQPIYHVSVSPTDGNGPTQGQRKTLTRVVRVFLCPCVGPFPSVGLTLTWYMGWNISTLHHILSLPFVLIFWQFRDPVSKVEGIVVDMIKPSLRNRKRAFKVAQREKKSVLDVTYSEKLGALPCR